MLATVSNVWRSWLRLKAAVTGLALVCGLVLAGISFGQVRETVVQITTRPAGSTVATKALYAWQIGPRHAASTVCALDGGQPEPCTSPWRYSGLGTGPHRFTVTAFDASGAPLGSASDSWTIERRWR
jgi:hypothetical protein